MKRLLFILFLFSKCFAQPATPPTYNFINSKYDWVEGKFRTLHAPSGSGTPTLYGGWTGAGAVYWDSIGKALRIWDGVYFHAYADSAYKSGSSLIVNFGSRKDTVAGLGSGATVGTFAQRLALSPTDGTEFFQTNDGRNGPAGKYYYLNGIWNHVPQASEDFWYYFNDFSATSATASPGNFGNLNNEVSGTGATVSFTTGTSFFSGLISTGTTTTGYVKINTGAAGSPNVGFKPSTTNMYYQATILSISQKANPTDNFNIDAGFGSGGTTNPQTAGYIFRYDSTTSANWQYRNGSGAFVVTGVAVNTGTPYTMEVFVRSDSVFYWINNSQVGAELTSANTTLYQPYTRIIKTAGTTAVTMNMDYIKVWARLQSSRTIF